MPSNDIYMPETIRPTRLYIKQHSITGLKYFGKTISANPYKYLGSGTRWLNHIRKHGIKFVETIWLSEPYTDAKLIGEIALKFSAENDIVNSAEWANLKFETGLEGGNLNLCKESIEKCRQAAILGGIKTRDNKLGLFAMTEEERLQAVVKSQEACLSKYGVVSVFSFLNKDPELIAKKKLIFAKNNHQKGEKNSQFGKMWICNLELKSNKKIKKEEFLNYESAGWIKGRRMNFS